MAERARLKTLAMLDSATIRKICDENQVGSGAMAANPRIAERYPKNIELAVGRPWSLRIRAGEVPETRGVSVRLMVPEDKAALLQFARGLPPEDLLFLRSDITDEASIDEWVREIQNGTTITLLVEVDGSLAACASIHLTPSRWTRRIGEIRINVAQKWQGAGIGKELIAEILTVARSLDLRKLTAQMVADQKNARSAFERLGFHVEALLPDWVEDRNGHAHDLLMMAYDLRRGGVQQA